MSIALPLYFSRGADRPAGSYDVLKASGAKSVTGVQHFLRELKIKDLKPTAHWFAQRKNFVTPPPNPTPVSSASAKASAPSGGKGIAAACAAAAKALLLGVPAPAEPSWRFTVENKEPYTYG